MKKYFKTQKNNLLLIAGIIWGIAGYNILRIGISTYVNYLSWWRIIISIMIFLTFQTFIFRKMVRKHTNRITKYDEDRQYLYKFFDLKGFLIMAFMISLGVFIRTSGICPEEFIAVFYTGIGLALSMAGIFFIINFIKECVNRKKSEITE